MGVLSPSGMTGILPVDKPAGFTSFDVVAKLRGIFKTRKIGHAGTLDPAATGVLPIFLGGATKFCDLLPRHDKRYTATFVLGVVTDTQDLTGTVLETRPVKSGVLDVKEVLTQFAGEQRQLPPMYSAVRVNGRRLYDLARNGVEVERKARIINIEKITLLDFNEEAGRYTIDVSCSKGTYIRTLCHDIGENLGCGAALAELRRTEACGFALDCCRTLEELSSLADKGELASALLPVESAFSELPRIELNREQERLFRNGIRLSLDRLPIPAACEDGGRCAIFGASGAFLGLAGAGRQDGLLRHICMLPLG